MGEKNGKEHLTFKPQNYTIKATRERKEKGLILGSVGEYGRGETGGEGCGSGAGAGFDVAADCRQFAAKISMTWRGAARFQAALIMMA
jgi:hypothetical protein